MLSLGRRATAICCAVRLLTLGPSTFAAQQDAVYVLEKYRAVADTYRTRGLEAAKVQLEGLSSAQLRTAMTLLRRMTRIAAADGGWSTALFGSALVLHIDLFVDGAKRGLLMPWHLECAVLLLDIYRGAGADHGVRRGSTLAVAWLLQVTGGFELLRPHLKAALNDYPNDAEVMVARAVLEEAGASPRLAGSSSERKSARALREAETTYRRALQSAPALTEARVRLGYVLLRLHRLEEARHELSAARTVAVNQRDTYLAELFLAATHEAEGSADQAVASYRRAHEVAPDCQVAALGLAHALRLVGEYESAAATARAAAVGGPSACEDPWWSYDYGQAWKLDAALEILRRTVRQ